MTSYPCKNCKDKMSLYDSPFHLDSRGMNTARRTFSGAWVCSEECEQKVDEKEANQQSFYNKTQPQELMLT